MKLSSKIDSKIFLKSTEELDFETQFRDWVKKNTPPSSIKKKWNTINLKNRISSIKKWQKKLFNAGWMCVSWPKKYGGRDLPIHYEQIIADILAEQQLPYCSNYPAIQAIGKMILDYGTESQKEKFVLPIASGDLQCCLCLTESRHGVSFENNETTAKHHNNKFILTGEKIWSTYSAFSEYGIVLANTESKESNSEFTKTMFIVNLKKKGIKVTPLKAINGEYFYGKIVFDNVELEKEDILGHLNAGWLILSTTWMNEAHAPFDIPLRLNCKKLIEESKLSNNFSDETVDAIVHATAIKLMSYLALKDPSSSDIYRLNSPLLKVAYTDCIQKIADAGLPLMSPTTAVSKIDNDDRWDYSYFSSKAETIGRGPNEIHKNYIAKMFLRPKNGK